MTEWQIDTVIDGVAAFFVRGCSAGQRGSVPADRRTSSSARTSSFSRSRISTAADRRRHADRPVRRDPARRPVGARCKIQSHSFICDGVTIEDEVFVGHGVMFVNDKTPRATNDGGVAVRRRLAAPARDCSASCCDWFRCDRSRGRNDRRGRHGRRRRGGDSRRSRRQRRGGKPGPDPPLGSDAMSASRVLVIGLDSAPPRSSSIAGSPSSRTYALSPSEGRTGCCEAVTLRSRCRPGRCMMSSRSPGRPRRLRLPEPHRSLVRRARDRRLADRSRVPRLWDILSRARPAVDRARRPADLPARPVNGVMVSCFLTPAATSPVHLPADAAGRGRARVGEYLFDCPNFRTDDKDDLLDRSTTMTDRRFRLADHLLDTKPWELFVMVEMGPDRMHHGFWQFMDHEHRRYAPAPYEYAILDYHRHVDGCRRGCSTHAADDAAVLVVSDHGAKRMDGGIRVNEWLRREGLLATRASRRRRARCTTRTSTGRARPPGARAATTRASS